MSLTIAVDFDGTLCEDRFPEIGESKLDVLYQVKRFKDAGGKVILWTCRNGNDLKRAVDWCKMMHGIAFDAVNENLPEIRCAWGGDTRKVYVDYYLDDKNLGSSGQIAQDLEELVDKMLEIKRGV